MAVVTMGLELAEFVVVRTFEGLSVEALKLRMLDGLGRAVTS